MRSQEPQERGQHLMARKNSKNRKIARRLRWRKALDAILTRRVAAAVLAGESSIMAVTDSIEEPHRSRAIVLVEHLSAD